LFGDSSLTLYSTGGNGGAGKYCRDNNNDGEYNTCTCNDNVASPGSDNTGNGGNGGPCSGMGGSGGSGIIIIRNTR